MIEDTVLVAKERGWSIKLGELAFVKDHDAIGIDDGVESVGNSERCRRLKRRSDRFLYSEISVKVD